MFRGARQTIHRDGRLGTNSYIPSSNLQLHLVALANCDGPSIPEGRVGLTINTHFDGTQTLKFLWA